MTDEIHAEFNIAGGEIKPTAFVGGEISSGDEIISGTIDPNIPLFGKEYIENEEVIIEVLGRPFLGIVKGDRISIAGYGVDGDYIVVSIDENGMTVKPIEDI